MTVADVLRFRDKAWKSAKSARSTLLERLRGIAVEAETEQDFDRRVQAELTAYRRLRAELQGDRDKLVRDVKAGVMRLPLSVYGIANLLAGTASLEALLVFGAMHLAGEAQPIIGHAKALFEKEKGLSRVAGYALAAPYGVLPRYGGRLS